MEDDVDWEKDDGLEKTKARGEARCQHIKANKEQCGNNAGARTGHQGYGKCWVHGGRSPMHEKHWAKKRAAELTVTYGEPVDITPHEALLEEIQRTAGHVRWLSAVIRTFAKDDLVWGLRETTFAMGVMEMESKYSAGEVVWLKLYREERKHLANVCKDAVTIGLAERQVRVAEQQGAMLAAVMEQIFQDLQLSKTQWKRVPQVVRAAMSSLDPGGDTIVELSAVERDLVNSVTI